MFSSYPRYRVPANRMPPRDADEWGIPEGYDETDDMVRS
jgi:hypothetical protein